MSWLNPFMGLNNVPTPLRVNRSRLKALLWGGICPACGQGMGNTPALTCLDCALDLRRASKYDGRCLLEDLVWRLPLRDANTLWMAPPGSVAESLYKALKFGGKPHLGMPMGVMMAYQRDRWHPPPDLVVPVPLTPKRMWSRGYNQAALLAHGMANRWGIPSLTHGLRRQDGGLNLAKLGRTERFAQAATDFEQGQRLSSPVRGSPMLDTSKVLSHDDVQDLRGLHCLLVDDVMTTGATLEQCGKLLVQRGAELSVMVLARRLGKKG